MTSYSSNKEGLVAGDRYKIYFSRGYAFSSENHQSTELCQDNRGQCENDVWRGNGKYEPLDPPFRPAGDCIIPCYLGSLHFWQPRRLATLAPLESSKHCTTLPIRSEKSARRS